MLIVLILVFGLTKMNLRNVFEMESKSALLYWASCAVYIVLFVIYMQHRIIDYLKDISLLLNRWIKRFFSKYSFINNLRILLCIFN